MACYYEAIGKGDGTSYQEPETKAMLLEMGQLLRRGKEVARNLKQQTRPTRSLCSPEYILEPPNRNVSQRAAELYFNTFERVFRILHQPTFWAEYQSYWDNQGTANPALRLKVLLVIAIGSGLLRDGEACQTAHQWIYAAQAWLAGPLEKDRLGIPGLQIYCLTIIARQIFSVGADLVWMSMGDLLHRAMQAGLHRDPAHLPAMSILQAEVRRRLWATICELLAQSSLVAGMPPRVAISEFDTKAPANVNDVDITESTTELRQVPKTVFTNTSMQLALQDSLPLRLSVLHTLNGIQPELSYLEVLRLGSEITEETRKLTRFCREHAQVSSFDKQMLDYLVRLFLLPLYMPFAFRARSNPLFQQSLKTSLDVALSITSLRAEDEFAVLMARGGGMFRHGHHLAMCIISLELVDQVEEQHWDGTLQRTNEYLKVLKGAMESLIARAEERIRYGETNLKGHMFLRMLMAKANAVETDGPCELMIAQGGRDSLQYCLELVRERASAVCSTLNGAGFVPSGTAQEQCEFDFNWELYLSDHDFF